MSRLSRWTAVLITVCILINMIPTSAFAQEEQTMPMEAILSDNDETTVYSEETVEAIPDTASVETETSPTEENSQPTEEDTVSGEEEIQSAGEENVPIEEDTLPTGEETNPTEETTQPVETVELLLSVLETEEGKLSSFTTDSSAKYFADVLSDNGYSEEDITTIITESGGRVTLNIKSTQIDVLVLLSKKEQGDNFNYTNWIINFVDQTGTLELPDTFSGLGDTDYPFAGTFAGQSITLSIPHKLFKALDAKASFGGQSILWTGCANEPILAETLYVDGDSHSINMPLIGASAFSPYIGELRPKLGYENNPGEITLPDLSYVKSDNNKDYDDKAYPNAAGLLCGSMAANTKLKLESLLMMPDSIPVSISSSKDVGALVGAMGSGAQLTISQNNLVINSTLTAAGGDAGGLVGAMAENAVLCVSDALTLTTTVTDSQNAGGLVGTMAEGTGITLGENMTVTNTLTAQKSAGGIAGTVDTATGPITAGEGKTITLTADGKITGGENAGGLYGNCTASGDLNPFTGVTIEKAAVMDATVGTTTISNLTMETVTVGGNGSCGGLFGTLELTENGNKCTIDGKSLYVKLHSASETTYVGGIAGTLTGGRQNALVVTNVADAEGNLSATPHIIVNTKPDGTLRKPRYLGGLVGYQNATLEVKNTFVGFPYASQTYHSDKTNYYTGGLSAYVCDDMLLMADNMRIIFAGYTNDDHNGGVAGYTGKGSIVYLKNQLLLRDCPLQSVQGCGQIVAAQDCSLIYGPGVTITRWGQGMEVDDVGSYGELYRVSGLLDIGEDYSTAFMRTLYAQEGIYTLTDALDYACLALAWQSRGAFDTVTGITTDNWSNLQQCSIKLGDNLDLTGTGIGGLSRDVYSEDDVFKGTFDGNGKTLKLDIGAINAQAGTSSGDGRIYFHNSTGLFAGLSSTATVKNLTLAGSIQLSNNRLTVNTEDQSANMKTGALAGLLLCEDGASNITNVSTTVSITANSNTQTPNAPFYIGGLFGLAYGNGDTTLTLNGNLGASITHAISESTTVPIIGQCFHTGGAIGAVDASCTQLNIECNGAVISGKIERTGDTADNFYAGGLVGTIFPNESSSRTITLTNLKVGQAAAEGIIAKPFKLKGSAEKRMGGVLGGIWADTDVTISGLTVENATLEASGAAKLGGLVYRASGKWEVSSADLSGLTINASIAEALGLMVCQGGPYREPLGYNKNAASGNDTYKAIGGLYLVMTENWATAYQVPQNGNITVKEGCVFDEFVAYTAYADYTDGNKDTPPYSITSNGSGIISLKTDNGTVNMTSGSCNTYENRTGVGTGKNLYSRYYYNLPGKSIQGDIDSPEELLIWSVYHYSAPNLRKHFQFGKENKFEIGGTSSDSRANFNMEGLSYYPIRITDSSITVQYADVELYNQQIENQVSDEKSTRGIAGEHSQHYTMHCGLFLDFAAEAIEYTETKNYTMTVNGVSFAGTIGKVNGQSGALLCGTVRGKSSGKIATCIVTLANSDNSTEAVTLKGVSVKSDDSDTTGYKPVLIGRIWEYATLQANYVNVSSEQKGVAGSSLIGDVGHSAATGLALAFAGTIKLPSENKSVFTSATLLNSLRYQGSTPATYHINNVTYGYEISGSVEFADEQLWYFDEGLVSSRTSEAQDPEDFSGYLPYVAHSPAKNDNEETYSVENGYHELEVNVKPTNLLQGCGTYGDPYVLDSEKLLKSVAKYLEYPEKTINGWQICYPGVEDYHTTNGSDKMLTFDSATQKWSNGYTTDAIRKHLSNAYYVIEKDMKLVSFSGLGTEDYPFSGVIQGKDETEKSITMSGISQALIRYSNGSVVRNLNISLTQNAPLRSAAPEMIEGNRTANRAPKYFFGGVIGCVLGGDNIIENVTVSTSEGKTPYNFEEGYTAFAHLVPIGGYVGVIAGGGVIFRGTCSGGISNDDTANGSTYLYRNPIVGRVLGGYAFYDGDAQNAPDNTDKNYKINTITSGTHLSLSDGTLTIKDSEGLLLLSAIVSSGAGSYGSSLAYKTDHGVARVAKYDQIGANSEPSDYALANNHTTPYLLYREVIAAKLCQIGNQIGITLKLGDDLNMENYGNGYRGLSARYVSNAGFTVDDKGTTQLSPYTVVMRIKSFDGDSKTVSGISMNVKEYDDDDFHAASMGGIFNIVWTNNDAGGNGDNSVLAKNLTLRNCTVKLQYINNEGTAVPQAQTAYFSEKDGISTVAVGGFIGSANNPTNIYYEKDSNNSNVNKSMTLKRSNFLFQDIHVQASILSPNSAGALIGATGMSSTSMNGNPGKLLTNSMYGELGPSFLNCSYSNTDVTGYLAAGGMVGCAAVGSLSLVSFGNSQSGEGSGCFATCTITNSNLTFAENSTVQTKSSGGICGGVFGGIGMRGRINEPGTKDNKPMVNYLTGLPIIGTDESVCTLHFKNVKLYADLAFDQHITYTTSRTINGVDNGKTIAVGGCIGRISHANPVRIYQVQMGDENALEEPNRCKIQITRTSETAPSDPKVSEQYAGGLVGYGYTTQEMKIQDCAVFCTDISGDTAGGFVSLARLRALKVSNCIIQDCKVDCTTRAGGISGYSEGSVDLLNILLKDTPITKNGVKNNTNVARLVVQTTSNTIKAAGISIFATKNTVLLPDSDISGTYTGYVAYADYLAKQTETSPGSKAPYVTVNPSYSLSLTDSTIKTLIGDAVGVPNSNSYGSIAGQIWTENNTSALETKGNYASYPEAKSIGPPTVSTFNRELGEGPADLPVLVVKGGDSKAITDYLDIITNGGYTAAAKDTVQKVTFQTTVYYLNEEQTAFSTTNWDTAHTGDPSVTTTDDGKTLVVSGTSYDNTRHRFTLVEATFNTDLDKYTVSIPVVVLRKLEYVYMTTFSYGTEFHKETYQNISTHLLESTDVPFSAYLTFRYNQAYNTVTKKLENAQYDWKSYIEAGGNILMDKTLNFSARLPKDTQLTLVDCQHGNQSYYYIVKESGENDILLSRFRKNPDNPNTSFQFSMADVLGVTRSEEAVETGDFTRLTNSEGATLLVNGEYFRPVNTDDAVENRFNLVFPENLSTAVPEENYYLVVTVPTQYISEGQPNTSFNLNGFLSMGLDCSMPKNGTQIHRYDQSKTFNNSDETTYQISSGYQQSLEPKNPYNSPVDLNDANNSMHIEVQDTITFSNTQAYSATDLLYLKFTANLKQNKRGAENALEVMDYSFPAGTTGIVRFYIEDAYGNYYVPNESNESGWSKQSTKPDGNSVGYPTYRWVSDGSNMMLPLSADGTTPIDLSGVRTLIKGNQNVGTSQIIVTAIMEDIQISFGGENDPIPPSKDGTDTWAQIHYQAQLSKQARALNYSTVRTTADDSAQYYRRATYQAILSMDAARIRQLGVNPLALVGEDLDPETGRSIINLNAALNLNGLKDKEQVLNNTNKIIFTLSLERRNDGASGTSPTYEAVSEEDRGKFISFLWPDGSTGSSFIVSKDEQGQFGQGFTEELFQFPLTAYVAVDQEQYANYQIKMDVRFKNDNDADVLDPIESIDNSEAYVVYTYACIKPSFYEPEGQGEGQGTVLSPTPTP